MPKIFRRVTIALDDFDLKLIDYLRKMTEESVSQVFRGRSPPLLQLG